MIRHVYDVTIATHYHGVTTTFHELIVLPVHYGTYRVYAYTYLCFFLFFLCIDAGRVKY